MSVTIDGTTGVNLVQDGAIKQADLETAILPIGVGQTDQDVTASRAFGTTYTNTTGRPIEVCVRAVASQTATQGYLNAVRNSKTILTSALNDANQSTWMTQYASVYFIVPAGMTYSVTVSNGSATLSSWIELR